MNTHFTDGSKWPPHVGFIMNVWTYAPPDPGSGITLWYIWNLQCAPRGGRREELTVTTYYRLSVVTCIVLHYPNVRLPDKWCLHFINEEGTRQVKIIK